MEWLERGFTVSLTHRYTVAMEAGEYAEVVVEQRGADVMLVLENPWDLPVPLVFDSPTGGRGSERVLLWARRPTVFRLTVKPWDESPQGTYAIAITEHRPGGPQEAARARAHLLDGRIARFAERTRESVLRDAQALGQEALRLWQEAGDDPGRLRTLERLGDLYRGRLRDPAQAEDHYREALSLAKELGDSLAEGRLSNSLGVTLNTRTAAKEKEALFRRALQIGESREGDEQARGWAIAAAAQHNLGYLYEAQSAPYRSLSAFREAEKFWRRTRNRQNLLETLQALGRLYLHLRREESARGVLEDAVLLADRLHDPRQRATALRRLGQAHLVLGDLEAAREALQRAIQLSTMTAETFDDAQALYLLGEVHRLQGDLPAAERELRQALEAFAGRGDGPAIVLSHLTRVAEDRGDRQAALAASHEAKAYLGATTDTQVAATVHWVRARALRFDGRLAEALEEIDAALSRVEQERRVIPDRDNRAEVLAFRHQYFDFAVDLLLEMDRREGGKGYRVRAFGVEDRGRARSLLESMQRAPSGSALGGEGAEALRQEAAALWREIRAEDVRRASDTAAGLPDWEWRGMLERYRLLMAEMQATEAEVDTPPALSEGLVKAVQAHLEADTRLLSFSLAEPRGRLWVVGPRSLEFYPLPSGQQIDQQARYVSSLLGQKEPALSLDVLRVPLQSLADMLFPQPLADLQGVRRLLIVGDGALHSIPFAALPSPRVVGTPGAAWRYLVEDFETVSIPSASVLLELVRERRSWTPESLTVGVVSDAVYHPMDPRLLGRSTGSGTASRGQASGDDLAGELGLGRLGRLKAAADEARAILDHFPPERRMLFSSFAASRQTVLGSALNPADIVHLIAHGEINAEHPELSRLVFSLFDPQGEPLDGFVRAHEVYGLAWRARLVVLSACETALGREIRGEGLVGLTQGFFHIGATRVIVSLWAVDDRATADLMGALYEQMVAAGLEPAAALRQAQLHLLRQESRDAPYYWAPFLLQGDWR